MEAVAAETVVEVGHLRPSRDLGVFVFVDQYLMEAEHYAFVGHGVEVVQLRLFVCSFSHRGEYVGVHLVLLVRTAPEHYARGVARFPCGSGQEVVGFGVVAGAAVRRRAEFSAVAQAVNPFLPEGIVEHGAAVATCGSGSPFDPGDTVGRDHRNSVHIGDVGIGLAEEHLVAVAVARIIVEHNCAGIRMQILEARELVGAVVEIRPVPIEPVGAGSIGHGVQPAGFVPHLELAHLRIPPDASVFRTGSVE